jgi:hypothetical protein
LNLHSIMTTLPRRSTMTCWLLNDVFWPPSDAKDIPVSPTASTM